MESDELARQITGHPAVRCVSALVLHGSRARGDAGPDSDWDVGVLATPDAAPDLAAIGSALVEIVGTERVDVSDLRTASALLRFRAARDGFVLLERDPGTVLAFREEAVRFWCDAGPVIRAAQDDVLAGLG